MRAPAAASSWTVRLRTRLARTVPPGELLPDRQPEYVASWIYVFGVLSLASLLIVSAVHAQTASKEAMPMPMPMKGSAPMAQASAVLTDGVVQDVDAKTGVVTLKHGDIVNMAMPAMTMAFAVANKKMLDGVKTGDKVRFHVEMLNGQPMVPYIEMAK